MNEDNDIIFEIADQFSKLKDYDYSIVFGTTKGKPKLTVTIDMSCLSQRFTHIVGLEHIKDFEDFNMEKLSSSKKVNKRSKTLNKILSKLITFQSLKQKSNMFFNASTNEYYSFDKTVNPTTGKPYTIIDRLSAVKNIKNILDDRLSYGKLYERNSLDFIIGHTNIPASFVIRIPASNKSECLYFFLEKDNHNNLSNSKNTYMRIMTAFSDSAELIKDPINTYTVLKIDRISHSNQSDIKEIYISPQYLHFLSSKNQTYSSNKTEYMKMDFGNKRIINSGGAAVLAPPRFSFGQALANIINGWAEKIKADVEEHRRAMQAVKSENSELKQENSELKQTLAERDEQLTAKDNEIANLREENLTFMKELIKQKQLVREANPPKTLSQKIEEAKKRCRERNAATPPRSKPPNNNHHR